MRRRSLWTDPPHVDDGGQRWVLGDLSATAANASFSLPLGPAFTDLAIVPGYGVTIDDSLPAFFAGSLGPFGTADFHLIYEVSPGVGSINLAGGFVNYAAAVPEPSSLALLGLGTLGLLGRVRRRVCG